MSGELLPATFGHAFVGYYINTNTKAEYAELTILLYATLINRFQ